MAGFSFDNGGRRCIRPILEKYQSGKGHWVRTNYFILIRHVSRILYHMYNLYVALIKVKAKGIL